MRPDRARVRESVLWFVTDEVGTVARPVRLLKRVDVVELAPGERREVGFTLTAADLSGPDADGRPVLEPGVFAVSVGQASASFRLR
ncbi:fibronectin type III-like domain-contianing protein [Rubrivirga sp.]|uniref:fibronectin type III-like domain-contianing protein n=1 Tax=Rubrivirga sp. TaxID=1885344 RepID=UPI003B5223D2